MDEDVPEKRISELERQLAAPRTAGQSGSLTPELVRNVSFAKPPIGKRGYNEDEVDAFLDLIEAALAGGGRASATAAVGVCATIRRPADREAHRRRELASPACQRGNPILWLGRLISSRAAHRIKRGPARCE